MWPIYCPETSIRKHHSSLRNNPVERSSRNFSSLQFKIKYEIIFMRLTSDVFPLRNHILWLEQYGDKDERYSNTTGARHRRISHLSGQCKERVSQWDKQYLTQASLTRGSWATRYPLHSDTLPAETFEMTKHLLTLSLAKLESKGVNWQTVIIVNWPLKRASEKGSVYSCGGFIDCDTV